MRTCTVSRLGMGGERARRRRKFLRLLIFVGSFTKKFLTPQKKKERMVWSSVASRRLKHRLSDALGSAISEHARRTSTL